MHDNVSTERGGGEEVNKLQERLISYRDEKELSQEQFAELIGVDQPTVGRWEKGRFPSKRNMHNLARLFACDVRKLAGELYWYISNPTSPDLWDQSVKAFS